MLATEIIKKKRNKLPLSAEEIRFFILEYTKGQLPDYQMAALLMAIYFNGMNEAETIALTETMLHSGVTVDTSRINGFKVDKHSTGGVGDKTSLILGPIVAATGLYVPMISGRGLGHTGGTLDKLESIPGFDTQMSLEQFVSITEKIGTCFIGQTKEICPADKKIYALRDVTSTIESFPLICASIMSKKLAEGIDGLVLDVKFGTGAFMKTSDDAVRLAKSLMAIAKGHGKKIVSLISSMNQPLGRFAGNSLEVFECVEIMKNKTCMNSNGVDLYADTRELSLLLSAHMIHLAGKTKSVEAALEIATSVLTSGKALRKFEELCTVQFGKLELLPKAIQSKTVCADRDGYLNSYETEKIGLAGILLHAGRTKSEDPIIPTSGIEFHFKIGDKIKKGDVIYTLHCDDPTLYQESLQMLNNSFEISLQKPAAHVLIKETL